MGKLFPSFSVAEEHSSAINLDHIKTEPLFHSIEYELSGIINKINNIDNMNEKEIKDIIIRQHGMILNYDLFLMSFETRTQAQILFTNKRFLKCFLDVIRLLNITYHEKICINKLAYDYYIIPDKNQEISDLLYRLTTEVNGKEVIVLSGIIGMYNAQVLSMIRNSSFKEDKCIRRVNNYIVKCGQDLSIQCIVNIYCSLFDRFSNLFTFTMMESKPDNLSSDENRRFDYISVAMLEILNSLPSCDIKKVILDYAFTLKMVKINTTVRFAIKSASKFNRIIFVIREVEIAENIIIP